VTKKVVVSGLVFVAAALVIGVVESLVVMVCRGARFESILGERGWVQYLFAYSTVVPTMYLRGGTDAISRLKFFVLALVVTLLGVSIWRRKFWLSLMAYTLGSLYWLLMVYSVTGVPLD
jgi:hypothetical protein